MATNGPALTCSNSQLTFMELLMGAIDKNSAGNPTLRLYNSAGTGVDYITCTKKSVTPDDEIKNLFTLNAAGKIALRVAITP